MLSGALNDGKEDSGLSIQSIIPETLGRGGQT
jgi:hypothetical protein